MFFTGPQLSKNVEVRIRFCSAHTHTQTHTHTLYQVFQEPTLNAFMGLGRAAWNEARAVLQRILAENVVRERERERGRERESEFDLSSL